ncbi:MAG TPA: hypothetical protein VFX17_02430 [Patescibacteria group bacterium]|nr:hypothetical protein [Patescibacteria group bacterium]
MRPNLENSYVERIDRHREQKDAKPTGGPAEELVAKFNNTVSGLETRFSTKEEDKGPEIGGRQTVDLVSYLEKKPALAIQITTNTEKGVIKKKLEEISQHPFIRLEEMAKGDTAIPKVLVYLDAQAVRDFANDPDFSKHPEVALQIIKSYYNSLKFSLTQTKNPLEQKAIKQLMEMFEQEKKKYLH